MVTTGFRLTGRIDMVLVLCRTHSLVRWTDNIDSSHQGARKDKQQAANRGGSGRADHSKGPRTVASKGTSEVLCNSEGFFFYLYICTNN